jgi:alanine dehydrogenase
MAGLNVAAGQVTNKAVAKALGHSFTAPEAVL